MDFDLAEVISDVAAERLQPSKLKWKPGASVCVVLASGGYPGKFEIGKQIDGLTAIEKITGVKVLHAGTKRDGEALVTNSGRVLGVTASGESLPAALSSAYAACAKIHFEGMHYRKDIGAHSTQLKAAGD
jgi:phosphoribosylamine--glycine ligase